MRRTDCGPLVALQHVASPVHRDESLCQMLPLAARRRWSQHECASKASDGESFVLVAGTDVVARNVVAPGCPAHEGRRIVRTGPIPGLVFYRRRGARGS